MISLTAFNQPSDSFYWKSPQNELNSQKNEKVDSKKKRILGSIKGISYLFLDRLSFVFQISDKIVLAKHVSQLILLPIKGSKFIKNCISFPKDDPEKQIDAGLTICDDFRETLESTGSVVVGLEKIKTIPSWLVQPLATPFALVLSALSIASIVSNIRTCRKVKQLMNHLNQAEESGKIDGKVTYASYKAMLNVLEEEQLKDPTFVFNIFNITQDQFVDVFVDIEIKALNKLTSHTSEEIKEGQEIVEKVVKSVKKRVKQNITSSALAIISSMVNIVGTGLLLTLPTLPLGLVIIGVKVVIDSGRLINHKIVEYQFAKAVDLKRTKWEWVTC